jgi:glycosyltransferase involved in cell wall biosynthesis
MSSAAAGGAGLVSVLMPVYNEEATVGTVIRRVLALGSLIKEIIVVDDGSSDRTGEIVQSIADRNPVVRYVRQPANRGKTAAIQRALQEASGEIVIVQDADLEYDPSEIPAVIEPILSGHADVVYGSRFLVRRAARVLYFYHYLANSALTFLSNLLTNRNMTDIETCYKAFRAGVVKPLELTSRGFGMEVEITALVSHTRARTYEVPISYYGRSYEEGKKIGYWDGVMAGLYILYYNLVAPYTPRGRRYIAAVNAYLERELRSERKPEPPARSFSPASPASQDDGER